MYKKDIMLCRLCIAIVFLYNLFVADTYMQSPLIFKSTNITTMIGETIEFNCSEYMKLQQYTTSVFKWYKDYKPLTKAEGYSRMSLLNKNEVLKITNITTKDSGTYECAISNQFKNEYSIYRLIVYDLLKIKIDKRISSNETINIGEPITWLCSVFHGKDKNIDQYVWLKNGKPFSVNKNDKRITSGQRNELLKFTNITYKDKGTYECLASNKFKIDSSKFILDVVELPNKTFYNYFNRNVTLHIDESVIWRCLFSEMQNKSNFNYTWLKNDEPLRLSKNDTNIHFLKNNYELKFKKIRFDNAGNYRCIASNEFVTGYVNRILTVVGNFKVMTYRWFISNIRLMIGVTIQLRCNTLDSTKNYPTKFSWKKNGEPLVFSNQTKNIYLMEKKTKNLLFLNITSNETVTYECKAENYYHKMYSTYTLNIVDETIPKIYTSSNSTITVNVGESVQLFCYTQGIPPPVISWLKNGNQFHIPENNDRVLLLEHKQMLLFVSTILEDNGTYACNVSNRLGSKVSIYTLSIKRSMDHDGQNFTTLIFCILFLLIGILTIYYVISFKRKQIKNVNDEKWNTDLSIEKQVEPLPNDKEWEYPRNKLTLGKQLGSGSFGDVFKADAIGITDKSATSTVIVKMVKPNSDTFYTKALLYELKIMIHTGIHLNIVNLLGTCTEHNNNLMVIIEYCRYGSIREFLLKQRDSLVNQVTPENLLNYDVKKTSENIHNENNHNNGILFEMHKNDDFQTNSDSYFIEVEPVWCSNYYEDDNYVNIQPLCTHDLICWSFQVALGMEYLASRNIFHGDLATRNILLADDNIVKISDYGLPKNIYNGKILKNSKNVPLPVKWMAIESLREQVFSIKSDVWSFGIVLWEIFSLAVTPYPNIKSYTDLLNRLDTGYRMERPKYASIQLYDIMLDCWNISPTTRPSFSDLAGRIGDLLLDDSKSYYINLNEDYVRMNTNKSFTTDYINFCARSTHINHQFLSEKNSDLHMKNDKLLQNNGLELKNVVLNDV